MANCKISCLQIALSMAPLFSRLRPTRRSTPCPGPRRRCPHLHPSLFSAPLSGPKASESLAGQGAAVRLSPPRHGPQGQNPTQNGSRLWPLRPFDALRTSLGSVQASDFGLWTFIGPVRPHLRRLPEQPIAHGRRSRQLRVPGRLLHLGDCSS